MNDLIERIEAASGPDRELDHEIYEYLGSPVVRMVSATTHGTDLVNWAPFYTASVDAALTLVPEGWRIGKLEQDWRSGGWIAQLCERPTERQLQAFDDGVTIGWNTADTDPDAATPALALCAAALKARAYLKETNNAD